MNYKWMKIIGGIGFVAGIVTPQNHEMGVNVLAFAAPWAIVFGLFGLLIDFIIQKSGAPNPDTHVKCPDCREFVLKDARKCKHCGCNLIPQ